MLAQEPHADQAAPARSAAPRGAPTPCSASIGNKATLCEPGRRLGSGSVQAQRRRHYRPAHHSAAAGPPASPSPFPSSVPFGVAPPQTAACSSTWSRQAGPWLSPSRPHPSRSTGSFPLETCTRVGGCAAARRRTPRLAARARRAATARFDAAAAAGSKGGPCYRQGRAAQVLAQRWPAVPALRPRPAPLPALPQRSGRPSAGGTATLAASGSSCPPATTAASTASRTPTSCGAPT